MGKFIKKFFIFLLFFVLTAFSAYANEPVKINGLTFDDSDSIILINSTGEIDDGVTVNKGYLKDPDRIFIDINNSILTTQKKAFSGKYSKFKNIKISQFTLDPNKTVRLVFEYDKTLDISAFGVYKTGNSLFIKYNKKLVSNNSKKIVYSNTKSNERTTFFKGANFNEVVQKPLSADEVITTAGSKSSEILKDLEIKKEAKDKLNSKYYIDSITKTKNGILVNGIGKLSLMPSFTLQEPDRLIIDFDDTVLNSDLRNKTFAIGEMQIKEGTMGAVADTRDTVKFGQNSQSVARLVIKGKGAKDYRGIISPDSKSFYMTNKTNIIGTKIADINTNLTKAEYTKLKDGRAIALNFDDSSAFSVFEENSNLYLDIQNINSVNDGVLAPLSQNIQNFKTVRIATDKLRFIIPASANSSVMLKTNPDNNIINITIKEKTTQVQTAKKTETKKAVLVPVAAVKNKKPAQISNLYTVVIDAGHGGSDVGATRSNIYEKDITLKIAKLVESDLNKKKVKTYMVRDKDKTVSLAERSNFSNEKKPDLFVSIHVNSSTNETSKGVETHWYKQDSLNYAKSVHNEMKKKIKSWNTNDRGLFNSRFYVINHTEAPAILCEIGFISNKEERDEITKPKRQSEIAEAISNGVYNYLKAKK